MPLRAQLKAACGGFSPMSDCNTARETVGPVSHRDPETWSSGRGHYRTERPRPGVSGRGYFRPERPRPSVPGTGHYRPERPRPDVPGMGHYRPEGPRPRAPGRGHFRPRFPARLPTGSHRRLLIFLLNTPQIMWCCIGSPVLFFAVVAFVVCGRRRVIFSHGAVYDGRKGQRFKTFAQWS